MLTDIKTIFLPTDFSDNANQALPFAAEIALQTGATLTLIYCVEEPYDFAPMIAEKKEKIVDKASKLFDEMVTDLEKRKRFKDLKIETKLFSGHPVVNILEEAKTYKAGLIVMGTKGATGSRKLLFGSMTTETIIHSDIPVMAIPEHSTFNKFKRIIFATDFHESDLNSIDDVINFAKLFDSQVHVIHVAESSSMETEIKFRGYRDLITDKYPETNINFDLIFEEDFFSGIADYLDKHPADLLVMVRHKKSFWESLVTRNHSKEMGFYTNIPLLILLGQENMDKNKTVANDKKAKA